MSTKTLSGCLSLSFCLVLGFGLAACGAAPEGDGTVEGSPETAASAALPLERTTDTLEEDGGTEASSDRAEPGPQRPFQSFEAPRKGPFLAEKPPQPNGY